MEMIKRMNTLRAIIILLLAVLSRGTFAQSETTDLQTDTTTLSDADSFPSPISEQIMEERGSTDDMVVKENVQQPQALHLTTMTFDASPPQSVPAEIIPVMPTEGFEGRKRRRLGRKRKRRPLQEDFWQGNPREEESAVVYRNQDGVILPAERKQLNPRWDGSGMVPIGYRQRADHWANPYSDAIDPQSPFSSDSPPPRRVYASINNDREHFQPVDDNRQRRPPRPEEESTQSIGYKAYRKPYSMAKRGSEEDGGSSSESGKTATVDLKTLLKQSDGLSLSEILQQRNISLQDLIKGKQMALAALTQSPLETVTVIVPENDGTPVSSTVAYGNSQSQEDTRRSDFQNIKSLKRIPVFSLSATPITEAQHPTTPSSITAAPQPVLTTPREETNSVEEVVTPNLTENQNENIGIFPTVEIKQLALNPMLPTVKEERLRPIKGIASRIRPDLSNANIRTEEAFSALRKRIEIPNSYATAEPWRSSTTTTTPVTPKARERWTPAPGHHEKREQFLQKLHQNKARNRILTTTSTQVTNNSSPEEQAEIELPSNISSERTMLRIPSARKRLSIHSKLRSPPPSPPAQIIPPAAESHTLADVELHEEPENVTRLLETEEPELNIIEKFTSFEDTKESESRYDPSEQNVGETAHHEQRGSSNENNLIQQINQNTQRSFTDSLEDYLRDVTESNPSLFNDLGPIALSEDRQEILELMGDHRIGSRLAKVLSQRNMTLEELLEHRKRGSSQLHLAEMINNKARPLEDKMDIVTAFEHFPRFNLGNLRSIRPDDIKVDSQGFSYFTSIINIRPTDEADKDSRSIHGPHHPDWNPPQSSHPVNHKMDAGHFLANGGSKGKLITPSRMSAAAEFNSGSNNNINKDQASDLLDLELSGRGFSHRHPIAVETGSLPLGVRSAIVASICIVGVSLAVFALIFVVCRWRQRRRNKLDYAENFNMAKARLPTISGEVLKTSNHPNEIGQMVYTSRQEQTQQTQLSRKESIISTMNPNSQEVQNYLWDEMRQPFQ
ncbi:uncharacterized protein LOC129775851 isoform X2 [Toxorhynchites rutilus septentrionalis]|uniref:uncharacterized protein LOC129775851 isoform X2 n=1 Tax=Toxorhynchites rutilus septentrionalis TaxID=329112 RepID=UPI00247A8565|nr:uncharacterized protein LOC129775851 isoform X2 [Toxorhynchites rutilus septentrionalis]